MRRLVAAAVSATLLTANPVAAAPDVVTDIPAVQSLVARVMEGVGEPEYIISPDASHHQFDLKPSQARAIAGADVVFWIGEALEPWLGEVLHDLADQAVIVELMDLPGMLLLGYPEDDGDEEDAHHDEDGHGHAHGEGGMDPHIWFDPVNGRIILHAVARVLSGIDPDSAAVYAANAEAGSDELDSLIAEIEAVLVPARGKPFMTAHDSYRYFENRFAVVAAGSVAGVDAASPSPERLLAAQRIIVEDDVVCIFIEPLTDERLVHVVAEGADVRMGVIDVDGSHLETGPGFYPALIRGIAQSLADCLAES